MLSSHEHFEGTYFKWFALKRESCFCSLISATLNVKV